jgi:hypothetical protein
VKHDGVIKPPGAQEVDHGRLILRARWRDDHLDPEHLEKRPAIGLSRALLATQ